jgi:hypothetical protein
MISKIELRTELNKHTNAEKVFLYFLLYGIYVYLQRFFSRRRINHLSCLRKLPVFRAMTIVESVISHDDIMADVIHVRKRDIRLVPVLRKVE